MFQFHKVQLKVGYEGLYEVSNLFQFHKVQLKDETIMWNTEQQYVSIP